MGLREKEIKGLMSAKEPTSKVPGILCLSRGQDLKTMVSTLQKPIKTTQNVRSKYQIILISSRASFLKSLSTWKVCELALEQQLKRKKLMLPGFMMTLFSVLRKVGLQ